jgi:transketolase
MRETLSDLIVQAAVTDTRTIMLSGDHGYALFDAIRKQKPDQFMNMGVMEQAMVGIAAGLAKTGFRPIVYGLAAFVPLRVLEQIKLDICVAKLPVIFLGDGAGLVYSTLGTSHQCAEDIACLRPLPHMRIFAPADEYELSACFAEARSEEGPAYIRIGKSDRPAINSSHRSSSEPYFSHQSPASTCLVAMGSMGSIAQEIARQKGIASFSVPRIKPLHTAVVRELQKFHNLIFLEEHVRAGGLTSAIIDAYCDAGITVPKIQALTLKEQFADRCGSYQYALSEHDLSDAQVRQRITRILSGEKNG